MNMYKPAQNQIEAVSNIFLQKKHVAPTKFSFECDFFYLTTHGSRKRPKYTKIEITENNL